MREDLLIAQPLEIKGKTVKNRIAYAPMVSTMAENGHIGKKALAWYDARLRGGVGFAMVEGTNVTPSQFREFTPQVALHDDKYIDSHRELIKVFRKHGVFSSIQLAHAGMMGVTARGLFADFDVVTPSPTPHPTQPWMPICGMEILADRYSSRSPSVEEIKGIVRDFADAARRAKTAGYDSVEIHGAHGVLINNFLSPFYNRRSDEYGGSRERRMRFCLEIIDAVRKEVGPDYPIVIRLSIEEMVGDLGNSPEDYYTFIVPRLVEAGIDVFDISMGTVQHSPDGMFPSVYYSRGYFMYLARAVKRIVNVPVIGVGRVNDMQQAEWHLRRGDCDIVFMGRQIFADPEAPNKFFEGRAEETRRCIGCLQQNGMSICTPCTVNWETTNESRSELQPPAEKKKIVVAGGGPAGLECARLLAERGHQVTVLEKKGHLGGIVRLLGNTQLLSEFKNLNDYHVNMCRKLGVEIQLNTEATVESVMALNPDEVVVAAGSTMDIPEWGQGRPFVIDHVSALENPLRLGRRILVVGLGYGAELALHLFYNGHEVTMCGKGDKIASNLSSSIRRFYLMRRLDHDLDNVAEKHDLNIQVFKKTDVKEVAADGTTTLARKTEEGEETLQLQFDTIIVSLGRKSNKELAAALKEKGVKVHLVGDAKRIGEICPAIASANDVGRKL